LKIKYIINLDKNISNKPNYSIKLYK